MTGWVRVGPAEPGVDPHNSLLTKALLHPAFAEHLQAMGNFTPEIIRGYHGD